MMPPPPGHRIRRLVLRGQSSAAELFDRCRYQRTRRRKRHDKDLEERPGNKITYGIIIVLSFLPRFDSTLGRCLAPLGMFVKFWFSLNHFISVSARQRTVGWSVDHIFRSTPTNGSRFTVPGLPWWSPIQLLTRFTAWYQWMTTER